VGHCRGPPNLLPCFNLMGASAMKHLDSVLVSIIAKSGELGGTIGRMADAHRYHDHP
jgi:hypothetical protein